MFESCRAHYRRESEGGEEEEEEEEEEAFPKIAIVNPAKILKCLDSKQFTALVYYLLSHLGKGLLCTRFSLLREHFAYAAKLCQIMTGPSLHALSLIDRGQERKREAIWPRPTTTLFSPG